MVNAYDYYPFGMMMPGRKFADNTAYRYGFQGQENDNEIKGEGNVIAFEYRIYDPRVGKFLSIDPLSGSYPMYSPYHFSSNQPLHARELEGLESEFDLNIPSSPAHVDGSHWTLDTKHKNPNGLQWTDPSGNKLSFDKAQFNADGTRKRGYLGQDHWHFEDAKGNRYNALGKIAKSSGANEAHLTPGTATNIKVKAVVITTTVVPKSPTNKSNTSSVSKSSGPKAKGKLGLTMISVDILAQGLGLATGDPDAWINQFGRASVGELKKGSLGDAFGQEQGNYFMIMKEETKTWSENGVQYKTVTRYGQNYEGKNWNKETKSYEGANPIGNPHIGTQTYKNGKLQGTNSGIIL